MARFRQSSSRTHLDTFARRAAASLCPGQLVLDAGAGDSPYARWFEAAGAVYECADHRQNEGHGARRLTYVSDLARLPIDDARFDLVLLSQVLEHLPEPGVVLIEVARVLKPGGRVWLSTPLFYEEHETPHDFFRYTQFGLRSLAERAGLVVEELDWLEGYLGTLGYQLRMAATELPASPAAYGSGLRGLGIGLAMRSARPVLRRAGDTLDRLDGRHRVTDRGMPKNYTLVARRPVS